MNQSNRILIIDDEPAMRHLLRTILEAEGYQVDDAENGRQALELIRQQAFDLVLCDIRMPELDGLGFLRQALALTSQLTIIMMSAYGSLETALECMKNGAYDYISKPFRPDEIVLTLKKAQERLKLQAENNTLRQELNRNRPSSELIYRGAAMASILEKVEKLAQVNSPVLIHGETGTGKELIARALHQRSSRHEQPFIALNCSAIASNLVESELFGHRKGAFTGADKSHPGLFAAADGGTLFLDEIGELPLEFQPKLLRALQEGEVRAVGDTKPRKINVRILSATACDLKEQIKNGLFREDLFYRLAVVDLKLPALRSRCEDVPALCQHFLERISRREQRLVPTLSDAASQALQDYSWPGNVRELENIIEKVMIFSRSHTIEYSDLPAEIHTPTAGHNSSGQSLSLKHAITIIERDYIERALESTGGNRAQAAKRLEISLRSLQYKIKEYQL